MEWRGFIDVVGAAAHAPTAFLRLDYFAVLYA
jgi:hypothetical protein